MFRKRRPGVKRLIQPYFGVRVPVGKPLGQRSCRKSNSLSFQDCIVLSWSISAWFLPPGGFHSLWPQTGASLPGSICRAWPLSPASRREARGHLRPKAVRAENPADVAPPGMGASLAVSRAHGYTWPRWPPIYISQRWTNRPVHRRSPRPKPCSSVPNSVSLKTRPDALFYLEYSLYGRDLGQAKHTGSASNTELGTISVENEGNILLAPGSTDENESFSKYMDISKGFLFSFWAAGC